MVYSGEFQDESCDVNFDVNSSDPHCRPNFLGFVHSPKPSMKQANLVEQIQLFPQKRTIQENDDPKSSLEIHTNAQEENSPKIQPKFT